MSVKEYMEIETFLLNKEEKVRTCGCKLGSLKTAFLAAPIRLTPGPNGLPTPGSLLQQRTWSAVSCSRTTTDNNHDHLQYALSTICSLTTGSTTAGAQFSEGARVLLKGARVLLSVHTSMRTKDLLQPTNHNTSQYKREAINTLQLNNCTTSSIPPANEAITTPAIDNLHNTGKKIDTTSQRLDFCKPTTRIRHRKSWQRQEAGVGTHTCAEAQKLRDDHDKSTRKIFAADTEERKETQVLLAVKNQSTCSTAGPQSISIFAAELSLQSTSLCEASSISFKSWRCSIFDLFGA
ncbi:hypothetical protein QBC43DRAFT_337444 [Cladorrhinum sp. PSN259]|nr:hypothetical protein QBC43DRAFT_337444 [Cladorrhinum sp. PSN259]